MPLQNCGLLLAQIDVTGVSPFLTNMQKDGGADGERQNTDEEGRRPEAGLENSKKAKAGP